MSLLERLDSARRRYRLESAKAVADPTVSLSLLNLDLDSGDPAVLAAVDEKGKLLVEQRQREHSHDGTYRKPHLKIESEYAASWVGGRKSTYESHRNLGDIGNCVVATQPFGVDSKPNPGLTVVVHGADAKLFARCYMLQDAPMAEITAIVERPYGAATIDEGHMGHLPDGSSYVDFTIELATIVGSEAASYHRYELDWVWADDNKVVLDREGNLRVRPDLKKQYLAEGGFVYLKN